MSRKEATPLENGIMLIAFGAVILAAGIGNYAKTWSEQSKCTAAAEGVMTDYHEELKTRTVRNGNFKRHESYFRYYPVYEFTADGKLCKATDKTNGSSEHDFDYGFKTEVHYDPSDPNTNYVYPVKKKGLYNTYGISGAFIIPGAALIISDRKKKRSNTLKEQMINGKEEQK